MTKNIYEEGVSGKNLGETSADYRNEIWRVWRSIFSEINCDDKNSNKIMSVDHSERNNNKK